MIQSILLSFFANAYNRVMVVGIALMIAIITIIFEVMKEDE